MDSTASTSPVIEVVANTVNCIERYIAYKQTNNDPDQHLAVFSVLSLSQSILIALRKIQDALDRLGPSWLREDETTSQSLNSVLASCQTTFQTLLDKVQPATPIAQSGIPASSGKARDLWPAADIEALTPNVVNIATGLRLLAQALNLELSATDQRPSNPAEERDSIVFADDDADAETLADVRNSYQHSPPARTSSPTAGPLLKLDRANRASLTLLQLVYKELVEDGRTNNLGFLTTDDIDFVTKAADAAREASFEGEPFFLGLTRMQIKRIPDHWFKLLSTEIIKLRITDCPITQLPYSISMCRNLTLLSLSHLELTEMSRPLFDLGNLRVLDLSGNPITVIPPEIQNLSQLELLHIEDCKIEVFPPQIWALEYLNILKALHNPLVDPPRGLYYDVIYTAAREDREGDLHSIDEAATLRLRAFHRNSKALLDARLELEGAPIVFCAGCSVIGFWHDKKFELILRLGQDSRTYHDLWQYELSKKVKCDKCILGMDALLILGDEITCSCTTHYMDERCLVWSLALNNHCEACRQWTLQQDNDAKQRNGHDRQEFQQVRFDIPSSSSPDRKTVQFWELGLKALEVSSI